MLPITTSMMVDTVSAVTMLVQFTTVPLRSSLTGLIDKVEITGKIPSAELLEHRNVAEPILSSNVCRRFGPESWRFCVYLIGAVSFSGIRLRVFPLHTGVIPWPEGEITAPPVPVSNICTSSQSYHGMTCTVADTVVHEQYTILWPAMATDLHNTSSRTKELTRIRDIS